MVLAISTRRWMLCHRRLILIYAHALLSLTIIFNTSMCLALVSYLPRFLSLQPILKAIPNAVVR